MAVDSLACAGYAEVGADVDVDARREYVEYRTQSMVAEAMPRPPVRRVGAWLER